MRTIDECDDDDDDDNSNKIIPFYNVQVASTIESQRSVIIAPDIEEFAPLREPEDVRNMCEIKTQTDTCYVPIIENDTIRKVKKNQKENEEPQKKKKRKRNNLDTIVKRIAMPTHASITRSSRVNFKLN